MSKKNQLPRLTVNLVRHGIKTYPKADEDYDLLRQLKLPLSSIDEDFLPLLERTSRLHNLHFITHSFVALELEMFAKVEAKWPFETQLTPSELIFKAPKKLKPERLESLTVALRRWYRRHLITLDLTTKPSAKSLKITFRKSTSTQKDRS